MTEMINKEKKVRRKFIRMKIGDLYVVETSKGKGYCHYIAKDDFMGKLIRVLPGLYQEEPNLEELVNGETKFYTFNSSLGSSIGYDDVPHFIRVGNFPIPEHEQKLPVIRGGSPIRYRQSTGKYEAWIYDGEYKYGEYRDDLTEEVLKLSHRSIPSIPLLADRIEEDYHPALDMIYIEE